MKKITLTVDGMMCGACEAHVNNAVRNAANVKSVESSHARGLCEIVCDDSVDAEKIVEAITLGGYRVLEKREEPYEKKGLFAKLFKK